MINKPFIVLVVVVPYAYLVCSFNVPLSVSVVDECDRGDGGGPLSVQLLSLVLVVVQLGVQFI